MISSLPYATTTVSVYAVYNDDSTYTSAIETFNITIDDIPKLVNPEVKIEKLKDGNYTVGIEIKWDSDSNSYIQNTTNAGYILYDEYLSFDYTTGQWASQPTVIADNITSAKSKTITRNPSEYEPGYR